MADWTTRSRRPERSGRAGPRHSVWRPQSSGADSATVHSGAARVPKARAGVGLDRAAEAGAPAPSSYPECGVQPGRVGAPARGELARRPAPQSFPRPPARVLGLRRRGAQWTRGHRLGTEAGGRGGGDLQTFLRYPRRPRSPPGEGTVSLCFAARFWTTLSEAAGFHALPRLFRASVPVLPCVPIPEQQPALSSPSRIRCLRSPGWQVPMEARRAYRIVDFPGTGIIGTSCPVDGFPLSEVMAGAPCSHLLACLLSSTPVAAAVISLAPSVDWYFVEGFVWIPSKNSAYLVKRKRKKLINSYSGPLPRPRFLPLTLMRRYSYSFETESSF
ncbi:uncharacterized protein [Alexandromys fortis]|uniref:uncharacterized protein n=1 Tax=Alexandromys fortis TaxID=100897 RepID=UPI002152D17E|nr:uncharacterized protein LOC126502498 [Microtus fortis]